MGNVYLVKQKTKKIKTIKKKIKSKGKRKRNVDYRITYKTMVTYFENIHSKVAISRIAFQQMRLKRRQKAKKLNKLL